jgi:hypothetical protein
LRNDFKRLPAGRVESVPGPPFVRPFYLTQASISAMKLTKPPTRPTLAAAAALLLLAGCDSVLDTEPTNVISGPQVFEDQALADAYLNDVYVRVNFARDGFADAPYGRSFNWVMDEMMGAELRTIGSWQVPYEAANSVITETGPPLGMIYWKYPALRKVNDFIERIKASDFDPSYVQQREAEARFLRAFIYFEMAMRYGAVPLITKAQSPDAPREELLVERTPEQEIYDFIIAETDTAAQMLPQTVGGEGRPTRWAALALQSRAALYAASIGEFGDMKLDGLLGVPDSQTQAYWQTAYDAAKTIIDDSGHSLYRQGNDPAERFQALFTDEGNAETIMRELFDGEQKGHSFTLMAMPGGFAESWGSNFNPFLNMVERFEFKDGSSGDIPRDELTSRQWSAEELFGSRDPRFKASVFYPETSWQGGTVYYHEGTLVDGEMVTNGTVGDDWPAAAPGRNQRHTGFQLRKMVNEEATQTIQRNVGETDYIIFRLGEMYLNMAEAALYLGMNGEALDAINTLRERVDMPPQDQVTEEVIRHERNVELAFEGHRYWDLRRWRTAVEELGGLRTKGLNFVYDWSTKKYNISLTNAEGNPRVFQEQHYYYPLGVDRLADNPKLVENPGY